jgi:hypothetical protein
MISHSLSTLMNNAGSSRADKALMILASAAAISLRLTKNQGQKPEPQNAYAPRLKSVP